jgi:hypothetical protein
MSKSFLPISKYDKRRTFSKFWNLKNIQAFTIFGNFNFFYTFQIPHISDILKYFQMLDTDRILNFKYLHNSSAFTSFKIL